jgi:hypothetical protein
MRAAAILDHSRAILLAFKVVEMFLILKITNEMLLGHLTLHIATKDVKLDFGRGLEPALFFRHDVDMTLSLMTYFLGKIAY